MNDQFTRKPPIWFWVVSAVALLWNSAGVYMYLQQAYNTEAFIAMYTPEQLEIISNTPAWATGAFAIAVFGGFLGCVGLLLRKKWAKSIFIASLIGIIVQLIYNVFISGAFEAYGAGAIAMPIMTLLVGMLLIWFSKNSTSKHWLS